MMSPPAHAAPRWRRFIAFCLNTGLLLVGLVATARALPDAPPPADAMAFYAPQDFKNYFSLVLAAVLLVTAGCAAWLLPGVQATPGAWLAGLKLVRFDAAAPAPAQVLRRWWSAVLPVLLLAVPGPLVALVVGLFVSMAFNLAYTTTDDVLRHLSVPEVLRLAIHGVSFALLAAAVLWVGVRPALRLLREPGPFLSDIDKITFTTYVRRSA